MSPQRGKRLRAYRETLTGHGLPAPHEEQVAYVPATSEGGQDGALRLLQQCPGISAIFAQNDLMAIGAMPARAGNWAGRYRMTSQLLASTTSIWRP